jgi:hypothetical protein
MSPEKDETDQEPAPPPDEPVLAIAAPVYITTKQTGQAIRVTGITMLVGLVYWAVVIRPQKGKAWNLKDPSWTKLRMLRSR